MPQDAADARLLAMAHLRPWCFWRGQRQLQPLARRPGIGFEGKADLYRDVQALVDWIQLDIQQPERLPKVAFCSLHNTPGVPQVQIPEGFNASSTRLWPRQQLSCLSSPF